MNKFLQNFARTGAYYPVKSGMFDTLFGGGSANPSAEDKKEPSEESKQNSQGSQQIAIGMDNAKEKEEDEDLSKIWEASDKQEEEKKPLFSDLTQEQVNEVAGKVQVLTQDDEKIIKVIAGDDEEKAKALRQLMTNVGQRSFASATLVGSKAFGQGVSNELNSQDPKIKELISQHIKEQSLFEEFPMATDPATKPIFEVLAKQVLKAFPNASRREVMEHTQKQLNRLAEQASKPSSTKTRETSDESSKKKNTLNVSGTESWENFFSENGR